MSGGIAARESTDTPVCPDARLRALVDLMDALIVERVGPSIISNIVILRQVVQPCTQISGLNNAYLQLPLGVRCTDPRNCGESSDHCSLNMRACDR